MSDANATIVYLVRHGATDANLRRPYVLQGRGMDLPLNETGRRQAQCVRKLFERRAIAAVYSSPLRRAFDTAQAIAEPHRLDVGTVDALIEADVGKWEGMSWDQIRRGLSPRMRRISARPVAVSVSRRRIVSGRRLAGDSGIDGALRAAPRPFDCRRGTQRRDSGQRGDFAGDAADPCEGHESEQRRRQRSAAAERSNGADHAQLGASY